MSRKSKIEQDSKTDWATAKVWQVNAGFGPFKPDKEGRTKNAIVFLDYDEAPSGGHSIMKYLDLARSLFGKQADDMIERGAFPSYSSIVVVDMSSLAPDRAEFERCMQEEGASPALLKAVSKPVYRMLNKILLANATLVAIGSTCQLLLKYLTLRAERGADSLFSAASVCRAVFLDPALPTACVNALMSAGPSAFSAALPVDVVFQSEEARDKRLPMLQHVFPCCKARVDPSLGPSDSMDAALVALAALVQVPLQNGHLEPYDPEYVSALGETLWASEITVEMSKYTKQYEQNSDDITDSIAELWTAARRREATAATSAAVEGAPDGLDAYRQQEGGGHKVGALVLRGSRCVLARSLGGEWPGMRVPAVAPRPGEEPIQTAVRSMTDVCDIDDDEFLPIEGVPPVVIFRNSVQQFSENDDDSVSKAAGSSEGTITVYAFYAVHGPPEGPLEDQDMEDEEDSLYDWYTYPRAVARLAEVHDDATIMALQTMSFALMAAASFGRVPNMWGGVFGQELTIWKSGLALEAAPEDEEEQEATPSGPSLSDLIASGVAGAGTREPIPVTILSGFLGAGKTTLLQHILTNQLGLRVALIINDMADVNIDVALIKQGAHSVVQKEERVVELTNGCICCTLREDLLVEVAALAAEGKYDYLIIESSGISEPLPVAETFTFTDDSGVSLSVVARLDTLVTVVDASTIDQEMLTVDSLTTRGWEADVQDTRTVAELMCDQIEFANVIILNKCDIISAEEQEKVECLLRKMNPNAVVHRSSFGRVDPRLLLNTRLFSLAEAEKAPMWLKEARIGEHKSESVEFGISNFTFRSTRPFHPERLAAFVAEMESRTGDLACVLRMKGFAWVASHMEQQGVVAFAGHHFRLTAGPPWWATLDREAWPEGLSDAIAPLWHEPYGDRQNELVVIGRNMVADKIRAILAACLLDDAEFALGSTAWLGFADPMEACWATEEESHDHDHSHDHHHHH